MLYEDRTGLLAEIGEYMELMEIEQYRSLLDRTSMSFPHWGFLEGKTIFLSGATGMLGSFLVDLIMRRNESVSAGAKCRLIAVGRNAAAAKRRFVRWFSLEEFRFVEHDITEPLDTLPCHVDYFIHGASTSHPIEYSTQPINTVLANVLGIHTILELAAKETGCRVLLLSSVEVYGENRGDTESFAEDYCGYLNCNTLRAGYPEAKRVSEALCQAYISEKGVDAAIIRLPRCYGPTMKMEDSKAIAQFIKNGVRGEDIVLKSRGEQVYSFAYAPDAVLGMLWVLLRGETGLAYNLGDRHSDIMQKNLAKLIADYAGTKVVFDLPGETERRGYSAATKALMDGSRLRALGWQARCDISAGIRETMDILSDTFDIAH